MPATYHEASQELSGKPFEAFGSGSFGLFWMARLLSLTGTSTSRTAFILLLASNSSSTAMIGLLIWCEILPSAIAGFIATGVIDQISKRSIMIAGDLLRALTLCIAAIYSEPMIFLIATAINSLGSSFFNSARAATLPALVSPEFLTKANALDQGVSTAVLILGPFIGAKLFFGFGLRGALLFDMTTFILSAALIATSVRKNSFVCVQSESLWHEIKDGWRYLRFHSLPRTMLILSVVSVLSVGLWIPLAPSFIGTFLKASKSVIAQQLTIFGVGGMCGALMAPWVTRYIGRGKLLILMFLAEAIAMLIYSRVSDVLVSGCVIFTWGMIVSGITVPFYSLLQDRVPNERRGRVFAIHEQTESFGSAFAVMGPIILQRVLMPQEIFAVAGFLYAGAVSMLLSSSNGKELFRTK